MVSAASCSSSSPRSSATNAAVSATKAGSQFWPRCGTGARKGESVSTSIWSAGSHLAVSCRSVRVLERHDARQRDVEAQVEPLARELGRAGEAVEHAGDAPFPHGVARGSRRCRPPRRAYGRPAARPVCARGLDMRLEALALRRAVGLVVEIISPHSPMAMTRG